METATTEIDTYRHTLSLHDALPICEPGGRNIRTLPSGLRRVEGLCEYPHAGTFHRACRDGCERWVFRSEEHTSELQSLMRISYAVFCLKTKTQIMKKYSQKQIEAHE